MTVYFLNSEIRKDILEALEKDMQKELEGGQKKFRKGICWNCNQLYTGHFTIYDDPRFCSKNCNLMYVPH